MAGWIMLFEITGIMYVVSGSLFIFFGTVEVQPWNEPNLKTDPI